MKFKFGIAAVIFATTFTQSISIASAAMLQGSVQQSALIARPQAVQQSAWMARPQFLQQNASMARPQVVQPMLASGASADAQRDERARVLAGSWNCMSQVTGSNVPGVATGTIVRSMVQYRQDARGNMIESWFQSNWSPASSAVVRLDTAVITSSRESMSNGGNGWSAKCQDVYKIVGPNKMIAESVVHQFVNGTYVGDYKTQSVLVKASS